MSWESSLEYYRLINQYVRARLGGMHSAKCVLVSLDFSEIEVLQRANRWDEAAERLARAARQAQSAGSECILICTNTMHKVAEQVQAATALPLVHIADATAQQVLQKGIGTVGLLGTRYTMEEDFYRGRLEAHFGLDVMVPDEEDRTAVHNIIFEELVVGRIEEASRAQFRRVMASLQAGGAQGIILGCTEIGLLVDQSHSQVPLFDTTRIHAEAAVAFALGG